MSVAPLTAVDVVDSLTLAQARRVAAMLDIDPLTFRLGDALPHGWHFAMLAGQTPRHALRSDGFPGLGLPMNQKDHQRLLLGQRETTFDGHLTIGTAIRRNSRYESLTEKVGRNGPFCIAKIEHKLDEEGHPARARGSITETQTYILGGIPPRTNEPAATKQKRERPELPSTGVEKAITPDDLLLFQYSALGFNTHRIHFDRDYATRVEGHPDLVVNGGLATLLVTEFLRTEHGKVLKTLSARHLAPLYSNRPMTIHAPAITDAGAEISLFDSEGTVAAELVMTFNEL